MDEAGVDTRYISTDAFEATGGYFGDGIEGIFHTTHAFPTANSGRVQTLDDSFAAATGAPSESPTFAALAVDGLLVLLEAHVQTGSADASVIGAAIPDVSIDGITSPKSYGGAANPATSVFVHEVVDGAPSLAAEIAG